MLRLIHAIDAEGLFHRAARLPVDLVMTFLSRKLDSNSAGRQESASHGAAVVCALAMNVVYCSLRLDQQA
jgi:hypothetical protein